MAERISFAPEAMAYNSMLAAEHISRYSAAESLCVGKRVLDIACGEGYGAALLKTVGAAFVLGVDISEEAIANARSRFSREGVEFEIGNALDLTSIAHHGPFDTIVSFETIEHVSDAEHFLRELKRVLAPGGSIVISCPNDHVENERDITNPFHMRTYSLADFKEVTQRVLGEASQWLIGTPITGVTILDESDRNLANSDRAMDLCLQITPARHGVGLPAQVEHQVLPETASFYLGVWNGHINPTQAHAPMSLRAYLWQWWEIQRLQKEVDNLQQKFEHYKDLAELADERAREIRRIAASEREQLEKTYAHLGVQLAAVNEKARKLELFRDRITASRAHRIADIYIRYASSQAPLVRVLRLFRPLAGTLLRGLRAVRAR